MHNADDEYPYTDIRRMFASFQVKIWTIDGNPIEQCPSEQVEQSCTLQFGFVIMIIVLLCDFVKTYCMGLIAWKLSSVPILSVMPLHSVIGQTLSYQSA